MSAALAFTRAGVRRLLRDRTALFFMVVLPLLIIVVLGVTLVGMDKARVAVVDLDGGPLATELAGELGRAEGLEVRALDSQGSADTAVRRSEVAAAVIIPNGFDASLRSGAGAQVTLLTAPAGTGGIAARPVIEAVVARQSARIRAAAFAASQTGGSVADRLDAVGAIQASLPAVTVTGELVGSGQEILPGGFSYSAPTMLTLFIFINAIAGGAAMIESRKLGIYERVAASPLSAGTIIAGEGATYLLIALAQGLLIVGVGALVFGVDWGSPVAAAVLLALWALVGASAGMLSGTLMRTPEQASAIAPIVGMALGMLGGCMWPLEIVGPTMRTVGHFTPHAWAVDAWTELVARGGGIADILRPLAALAGFAVLFLAIAVARMRRLLQVA